MRSQKYGWVATNAAASLCAAALLGLSACASRSHYGTEPPREFEAGKVFMPGDCFEFVIRGYQYEFTVSDDGKLELPLISERLSVAGLKPREVVRLVCGLYKPHGPRESDVEIMPCFKRMTASERAEAQLRAETIAKEAARKRGWKGDLRTIVLTSAPYQRVPETSDRWMIAIQEERMNGNGERRAMVVISVKGKVVSFTQTSPRQ